MWQLGPSHLQCRAFKAVAAPLSMVSIAKGMPCRSMCLPTSLGARCTSRPPLLLCCIRHCSQPLATQHSLYHDCACSTDTDFTAEPPSPSPCTCSKVRIRHRHTTRSDRCIIVVHAESVLWQQHQRQGTRVDTSTAWRLVVRAVPSPGTGCADGKRRCCYEQCATALPSWPGLPTMPDG